ncbi:MAG: hypothetical protein QW100_04615, partial [Thermoplasmatales archaeon]
MRRLLLKMSVVAVVLLFLGTSFAMVTNHRSQSPVPSNSIRADSQIWNNIEDEIYSDSLNQNLGGQGINGVYPWIPLGPHNIYNPINDSGKITAFAVDWANKSIMYVGSGYGPGFSGPGGSSGVYKTIDGGRTWSSVNYGLGNTIVDSLLMNQSDPNMLLATTFTGGIYKTTDGGEHWNQTATYKMTFNLAGSGSIVYVPTQYGVAVSNNFGSTWNLSLSTTSPIFSVTTTSNGADAYAIDWGGSIYFSNDYGIHWNLVHRFHNVGIAWSINVEPWNGSVVYLAYTDYSNSSVPSLWKSTDGGENWTSYPLFTGWRVARSVAFDDQNRSIVYVIGQSLAYYSTNNGANFTSMNLGYDNRIVWTNPNKGSDVYVGSDQGLFYTNDFGKKWISLSAPLNVSMLMEVAAANNGSELQVSIQDYPALYTLNGGNSWKTNYPSEGNWPGEGGTIIINPANSSLVYCFTGGVLKRSNTSGTSWLTVGSYNPAQFGVYFPQGIAVDPKSPGIAYLATGSGLYQTKNWGVAWDRVAGTPLNETIVQIDPVNNTSLWIGTTDGLWKGNILTNSWQLTKFPMEPVFSIAFDPFNSSIIVVGTGQLFGPGKIMVSLDGGEFFSDISTSLNINDGIYANEGYTLYYPFPVTDMLFLRNGSSPVLLVSTTNGLYLTDNLGETWENMQFNSISSIFTSIAVSGSNLFVSTWGEGVLEYSNFAMASIPATVNGTLPTNFSLLVNGEPARVTGAYTIFLSPGTYNFTVLSPSSNLTYSVTLKPSEHYTVSNKKVSVSNYTVIFVESGLPSDTFWSVTLNGTMETSTTSTISFTEPNGSYYYTVGIYQGYSSSPYSSSVTVRGSPVSVSVTFTQVKYSVTFSETGLPSGSTWYVNITNGPYSGAITGTSYSFSLPNGTYSYTIVTTDKTYEPSTSSGSFTVNGASVFESVTFSEVKYTVTFTESGLPSGTIWSVTLNGSTLTSSSSSVTFSEPNGTYSYVTGSASGYTASPSSGSIKVNGASVTQSVTFTPVTVKNYYVTFIENNLPAGSTWSVTINGTTKS